MKILTLKEISKLLSSENKNKTIAVAIILFFSLSAIFPAAFAQTNLPGYTAMSDRETVTAVGASPAHVGLTQQILINIMTYPAPSNPTFYAQDLPGQLTGGFKNITCTITKPDGTKDTFMPIDSSLAQVGINIPGQAEIVGSLQFYYTPTQVGNYSVTASFPGQFYTTDAQYKNMNLSVFYSPSSSSSATTFSVQQDIVLSGLLNGYPWSPLPTAYWTNPVFTNNREWSAISGPYFQADFDNLGTHYNTYSTAPSSPHILWATRTGSSGIVGGEFGSLPYNSASASGSIILDGYIYQADPRVSGNFQCIDLRTGEMLWSVSGSVNGAWQYEPTVYQTASQLNEGGVNEYLWSFGSTNWVRYNPNNGAVSANFTNVPTLSNYRWQNGDPIWWCVQVGPWNTTIPLNKAYVNLIKWNFTKVTNNNWMTGIEWNVSAMLPTKSQVVSPGSGNFASVNAYPFDTAGVVIVQAHNDEAMTEGFSEATGALLWVNNNTAIGLNGANCLAMDTNGPSINDAAGQFVAYNVKTGQEQWRADVGNLPWSLLPAFTFVAHNGNFYYGSYDGHVYALNSATGKRVWQSDYVGAEDESIYGNQPFNGAAVGAGGILYYSTATTYSLEPRTRFHELVAINETDGHFIWKLPIAIDPTAIAYGYLVGRSGENGIQYCIGKGQTETSLNAPLTGVTSGSSLTIQGTVMDLSPGASFTAAGTSAAISDADMSVWMDYLYGQNATLINSPPNVHGVTVQLTAVDSNGNSIDLGTATSDSSGQFATSFTPTTSGLYTIFATFAGSNSYYSSYGETHVTVVSAQAASSTPTATAQSLVTNSDLMIYLIAGIIAIIIAIAIVGILLLRKK